MYKTKVVDKTLFFCGKPCDFSMLSTCSWGRKPLILLTYIYVPIVSDGCDVEYKNNERIIK
ncbi:MAG: hypothetical protein ACREOW_18300 [Thermodesulfobacteriota bacterium]